MRYIEKTAIDWKEAGITSVEKADEHIKNLTSGKGKKKKWQPSFLIFSNEKQVIAI